MKPNLRKCPVCAGEQYSVLHKHDFFSLIRIEGFSGYTVVACDICGCCFANDIPEQEHYDEYYRTLSKYEYKQAEPPQYVKDNMEVFSAFLQKHLPDKGIKILDIGCSIGTLLHTLQESGYEDVTGLDSSPYCAQAAKELYGINVLTGSIFNSRIEKNFDLIIMTGVLEHIADLASIFPLIQKICNENTLIFLVVPDAAALSKHDESPFQGFSFEHINYFTPKSLKNIMAKNNYRQVSCDSLTCYETATQKADVVVGLFQKSGDWDALDCEVDTEGLEAIRQYIQESKIKELKLVERFSSILKEKQVYVWGLGAQTLRLIKQVKLSGRVKAFIDSNVHYHGVVIDGVGVISPDDLTDSDPATDIVIITKSYQKEIADVIKNKLRLPNRIVFLNDDE